MTPLLVILDTRRIRSIIVRRIVEDDPLALQVLEAEAWFLVTTGWFWLSLGPLRLVQAEPSCGRRLFWSDVYEHLGLFAHPGVG